MEIRRKLFADLRTHLAAPEITLLIGPRQAGKTTLLKALRSELESNRESCFFFNLDIDTDAAFFVSQQKFTDYIAAVTGGRKSYIFIDEVQRITNAGLFLKGLYDRNLPHKWIVTGSGSLELKEKIAESLVGRKRNFFLPTVSVSEYMQYATGYQYDERLGEVLGLDDLLENRLLESYMTFGGYPRVLTSATEKDKNSVLQEIYQGYIERDIQQLLMLEKSNAFVVLLQLMANRSGQLVNYNDLSKLTGISAVTLKNYLWYSEKTFVTASISPFFKNKEKEVVKAPQYYFWDLGMRNYLRGIFHDISDVGNRFQILIFRLLTDYFQSSVATLHYWRTQNQAEVDFVVNLGHRVLPVEVKSARLNTPALSRSFHSFLTQYNPPEAWIINRRLREEITIGETIVKFIPWYDLLNKQHE